MKKIIVLLLLAIFSLAAYPQNALADEIFITPIVDSLNVRVGPSTDDYIVGVLKRGEMRKFLKWEDDEWIQIDYDGVVMFVYGSYVRKVVQSATVYATPSPTKPNYVTSSRHEDVPKVSDYANYDDYLDAYYAYVGSSGNQSQSYVQSTTPRECNIKGNISFNTGEKIYHMPYQKYYHVTDIDERYGEQWFCSEQDAINAGWRRSRE